MSVLNRKDTTSYLAYAFNEILGATGLDVLGEYEVKSGTQSLGNVPAIQVRYAAETSQPSFTMVSGSGIEVVIESEPDANIQAFKGRSRKSCKYYQIILDQHDPKEGLTEAVEAVMTSSLLDIPEQPLIRPTVELNDRSGTLPPRAILYHRQAHYLPVQLDK